jgi:hypothetical protein
VRQAPHGRPDSPNAGAHLKPATSLRSSGHYCAVRSSMRAEPSSALPTSRSSRVSGGTRLRSGARFAPGAGSGANHKPIHFRVTVDGAIPAKNPGPGHRFERNSRRPRIMAVSAYSSVGRCRRAHFRHRVSRRRRASIRIRENARAPARGSAAGVSAIDRS